MAKIVGGLATSHVPAIGKAMCRPLEDLPHAPRALRPEDLA